MKGYRLTVGAETCDIRGFTNTHIQCAVDRAALLGGGEVELSEGTFALADAVHLRTNVTVRGQGEATVLRKNAMKQARIAAIMGYGHCDLVLDDPDAFEPGEGILVGDDNSFGFYQTAGTLVRREGDTWYTSNPHAHDYTPAAHGFVKTLFSCVSIVGVQDAVLAGVRVDGNPEENESMNGCRGSGVYIGRAHRVRVQGVIVRNYNGEGIGFQTCDDLELDGCLVERCTGNGLHPGSGSNRFHVHDTTSRNNGGCGLFYCLRVRHSLLENCVFENNKGHGLSTGGRDTDNLNRNLVIRGNGGAGIYLRDDGQANAAHRNVFENCTLEGNCRENGEAEIVLQGGTEGIALRRNTIRWKEGKPGILVKPDMPDFESTGNTLEPAGPDAIVDERGGLG